MTDRSWKELQADADAQLKEGAVGKAAHTLIAAINLNPNEPALYEELIRVALLAGGTETALDAATRLVGLDAKNANSQYLLGVASLAHGQAEGAKSAFTVALSLAPKSWQVRQALAQVLGLLKEDDRARALLEEAVRMAPTEVGPVNDLAVSYLTSGDAARAKAVLEPAARANPYESGVHLNLALAAMKLGDKKAAEVAAKVALKHADDSSIREQAERVLAMINVQ